jgi:hypothetical protein
LRVAEELLKKVEFFKQLLAIGQVSVLACHVNTDPCLFCLKVSLAEKAE